MFHSDESKNVYYFINKHILSIISRSLGYEKKLSSEENLLETSTNGVRKAIKNKYMRNMTIVTTQAKLVKWGIR